MKNLYNTPEIRVEELTKADVLCDSAENLGTDNKVESFSDTIGKQTFSLDQFLQ